MGDQSRTGPWPKDIRCPPSQGRFLYFTRDFHIQDLIFPRPSRWSGQIPLSYRKAWETTPGHRAELHRAAGYHLAGKMVLPLATISLWVLGGRVPSGAEGVA